MKMYQRFWGTPADLKYRLHLSQVSLIVIIVTAGTHKLKHFFFLMPLSTIRLTCPYASTCTRSFMPITTEEVGGFWEEVAVAELQRHGELFLEMWWKELVGDTARAEP